MPLAVDPESYLWASCPAHLSRTCSKCPRCFHGRFRCRYCYPNKTGTASKRPRQRHRLRCACCGQFRRRGTIANCERCDVAGFVALTLF